jgi:hypothetical protein
MHSLLSRWKFHRSVHTTRGLVGILYSCFSYICTQSPSSHQGDHPHLCSLMNINRSCNFVMSVNWDEKGWWHHRHSPDTYLVILWYPCYKINLSRWIWHSETWDFSWGLRNIPCSTVVSSSDAIVIPVLETPFPRSLPRTSLESRNKILLRGEYYDSPNGLNMSLSIMSIIFICFEQLLTCKFN